MESQLSQPSDRQTEDGEVMVTTETVQTDDLQSPAVDTAKDTDTSLYTMLDTSLMEAGDKYEALGVPTPGQNLTEIEKEETSERSRVPTAQKDIEEFLTGNTRSILRSQRRVSGCSDVAEQPRIVKMGPTPATTCTAEVSELVLETAVSYAVVNKQTSKPQSFGDDDYDYVGLDEALSPTINTDPNEYAAERTLAVGEGKAEYANCGVTSTSGATCTPQVTPSYAVVNKKKKKSEPSNK